jgi:hypothetical protein
VNIIDVCAVVAVIAYIVFLVALYRGASPEHFVISMSRTPEPDDPLIGDWPDPSDYETRALDVRRR